MHHYPKEHSVCQEQIQRQNAAQVQNRLKISGGAQFGRNTGDCLAELPLRVTGATGIDGP